MHKFNYGNFYPMSKNGHFSKIGEGSGKGYNINIPFNCFIDKDTDKNVAYGTDEMIYVTD